MTTKKLPNFEKELRGLREAVGEMLQRFRDLHSPIRESQEQMPEASKQLRKINDQTEAAATRVLDVAELLCERDTTLIKQLTETTAEAEKAGLAEFVKQLNNSKELAEQNQNDSFAIMEALQFQDITSQQLAHTLDLLDDIETRMDILLAMMDGDDQAKNKLKDGDPKEKAYDPNAEYSVGQSGQADVDSLISSIKTQE